MKIIGTGSVLPSLEVTNDMLSQVMDTNDEWIRTRTGIGSRHILSTEDQADIATEAAKRAIENAGIDKDAIDYVILSRSVCDYITPGLGCIVEERLGLKAPSIDINCACTGFVFALQMAEAFTKTGMAKNVLIIAAEEPSRIPSWQDRSTCVLFGDGAGAAIVSAEEDNLVAIKTKCIPMPEVLYAKRVLEPNPYIKREEVNVPLTMNGKDVFKMAVSHSQEDIKEVMAKAGITSEEVKYFVLHQANIRIIDAIRHFLGEPDEKFPTTIHHTGNTSSASIPVLLDELNRSGKIKRGDVLVLSAFGAGFETGAAVLRW